MAEQKAIVTLKDGTRITLDDPSQISQYSERDDLESISFFDDEKTITKKDKQMQEKTETKEVQIVKEPEQPDAGVLKEVDAGVPQVQTIATVAVPQLPVKLPEKPPASMAEVLPLLTGAIAGAVSSMGMPALTNLVKNLLKQKLGKGGDGKPEEEKPDEPTDCKTHQIKANAKFVSLSSRLTKLESKLGMSVEGGEGEEPEFDFDDIKDISEKVEKLEKVINLLKPSEAKQPKKTVAAPKGKKK